MTQHHKRRIVFTAIVEADVPADLSFKSAASWALANPGCQIRAEIDDPASREEEERRFRNERYALRRAERSSK